MLCSYILLSLRRSSPVCTILHSSMSLSVPLSSQICFYNSQFHLYAKSATMCPSAFLCLLPNTSSPLLPFPLISVPISPWRLSLPLHTTYSRIPCLWSTCTPNIFHITVLISNFKLLILADILLTPRHYSHTLPSRSPLLYFCYYLHRDRTAPVLLALLLFYLVSCLHYNINLPSLHHTYP